MTLGRLLLQSLFYHWRGNSAVLLGVTVGTAVLTGALLVGDSLRGSLRQVTLERLGWVDRALIAGRFIHQSLTDALPAERVSPVILLQGAAIHAKQAPSSAAPVHRAGRVTVLGVDQRFWPPGQGGALGGADFWQSSPREVVLNAALAGELRATAGQIITLHLQQASAIPRESLLGRRDARDVMGQLKLKVRAVLPDEGLANFSLNPTPAAPRNAFVPLGTLQAELNLKGRVNALLTAGGGHALQEELSRHLALDDWGLLLKIPAPAAPAPPPSPSPKLEEGKGGGQRGYFSLESRQLLLEPSAVAAALAAARQTNLRAAPTLVYLANSIVDTSQVPASLAAALAPAPLAGVRLLAIETIPYSVVAALDPALPSPLGPFLPPGVARLENDEIVLGDWEESPLRARPGDEITLAYFRPEDESRLPELRASFKLKGTIPLEGVAADPDLTPQFPGLTDKLNVRDWDPPFPYDNKRIQPRDERYWKKYRTTPKAYITLEKGQQLWHSRFGQVTSIRLAPADGSDLGAAAERFRVTLLSYLDPEHVGMVFQPVRARGLQASAGSQDFDWLFLGFSSFLIVAALLLVGLLFRLNLDRRAAEIGVLLAAGYRRGTVRGLLLAEGALLASAGALLGCAGAVVYAGLLLRLLTVLWPGALDRSLLRFHASWSTFPIGYLAALGASLLTIAWAVRVLGRVSPRALLAGETTEPRSVERGTKSVGRLALRVSRWSRWLIALSLAGAAACVIGGAFAADHELKAMSFFGSGALLLTAGLVAVWLWMHGGCHVLVTGQGMPALTRLGVRNAVRHPVRSLLTAGLLASATFLVVAVESFHREPERDFLSRDSGSGGFVLLGESALPIYQDLNTDQGRDELNFPDGARQGLQGVSVYAFRVRAGDDASCLNLYRPVQPRLLGVPHSLIERGGFRFQALQINAPDVGTDPWQFLERDSGDGAIPAFADATTAEWILKTKLNGEIRVPNAQGQRVPLRIVGLLQDSIFQSELLLSEANFLKLYPDHEGYNFFLVDVQPPQRSNDVKTWLETALVERGFEATSTARRLADYLAVENTYLLTFQALGGLGLLLGALGLAVVLLRSVWERRGELALLRALGYRHAALGWLVLAENGFLLVLGLSIGTVAALAAVAPHLIGSTGEVPWLRLLGLLALVLAVGLTAGAIAVVSGLRTPLLPALRRE